MTVLTADFHTHILSGIDDGSPTIEESVEMIQLEKAQGVKTILLTPHFDAQHIYPDEFVEKRQASVDALHQALAGEENLPDLIMGAEVPFCPDMSQWEQLKQLTLGDTGYILVEMPLSEWTDSMYAELDLIYRERGLVPILAHIERYLSPLHMRKVMNRLSDLPVLLQVNCSYFIGKFSQRTAMKLLNERRIHLLGSDCHGVMWRPPRIAQARDILFAHADTQTLSFLNEMEAAVLQGDHSILFSNTYRA